MSEHRGGAVSERCVAGLPGDRLGVKVCCSGGEERVLFASGAVLGWGGGCGRVRHSETLARQQESHVTRTACGARAQLAVRVVGGTLGGPPPTETRRTLSSNPRLGGSPQTTIVRTAPAPATGGPGSRWGNSDPLRYFGPSRTRSIHPHRLEARLVRCRVPSRRCGKKSP